MFLYFGHGGVSWMGEHLPRWQLNFLFGLFTVVAQLSRRTLGPRRSVISTVLGLSFWLRFPVFEQVAEAAPIVFGSIKASRKV